MAGGIFVRRPFHVNPKCIIISVIAMIFYWILPYRNPYVLPLLFVNVYIAIAWYDYLYKCNDKMYSGLNSTMAWAKHQRRIEKKTQINTQSTPQKQTEKLSANQESSYKKSVAWFHIIIVAPILLYIGAKKDKVDKRFWIVVLTLGLMGLLYHGLRLKYPREVSSNPEEQKKETDYLRGIYALHLITIIPLLLYIGIRKHNTNAYLYGIAFIAGLYSLIIHGYYYLYPRL